MSLSRNSSGNAAAEMALVLPMLLALMFGSFELGNYFLSEHALQKAVRDAARYAARLPMADYDCSAGTVDTTAQTNIQEVARFGDPTGTADGATARLAGWTADTMATVSLSCDDTSTGYSFVDNGIYTDFPDGGAAPVATVSATVPYTSLFGTYVFGSTTVNLNSASQAAVIGA